MMFEEYFVDNSRNWRLEESDTITARIEPEFYQLEHSPLHSMFWVTHANQYFGFEQPRFTMQCGVEWRDGDTHAGAGFAWDIDDDDNCWYEFLVSPLGRFRIGRWNNGDYREICGWTENPNIRQGQALNLLEIRRIEKDVFFLVNSELVCVLPASEVMENLDSHLFGFAVFGRASIRAHFVRLHAMPNTNTKQRPERGYTDKKLESGGQVFEAPEDDSIEKILGEIDGFVGLQRAKRELKHLANFARVQQWREHQDLARMPTNLHLVFTGAPGTGKTTFARLVSRLYKSVGLLPDGHTLETGASDLIAGYTGQTTLKIQHAIDRAWGGVLLIDEAYIFGGDHWYCDEALSVLLKNVEDRHNEFAVILAGYPDQMRHLLAQNPGLRSRFNRQIQFDSFSAGEMLEIFVRLCQKHDFALENTALEAIGLLFETLPIGTDRSLGNGRFVRTLFERLLEAQAARLVQSPNPPDKAALQALTLVDVLWLEGLIPVAKHLN